MATGERIPATTPTISEKNRLSTSQTASAIIAEVAALRTRTEQSNANASQKPMKNSDRNHQTISRATSSADGNDAELDHADGADQEHDHREDQADDSQAGNELAIDHVVAVDGLSEQARQSCLRPLAVDRVKSERDAQQRDEERDQRRERRNLAQCLQRRGGANRIRNSDCVPEASAAKLLITPPVA